MNSTAQEPNRLQPRSTYAVHGSGVTNVHAGHMGVDGPPGGRVTWYSASPGR